MSNDFSRSNGWESYRAEPRTIADLDSDGVMDLVGFSSEGVRTRLVEATTDIFMFDEGFGSDEVSDFDLGPDGDRLDVSALSAFDSFEDVMAAATQDGADTVIEDGTDVLRLLNVRKEDLSEADFLFT